MTEHHHQHYIYQQTHPIDTTKTHSQQQNEHSTSKVLAVLTLFPIGGVCFLLSGLILTGTLIGLTIATPLFFIFSPILVPAMLIIVLAVIGFLTWGAFGITAFSSLVYMVHHFRRTSGGGSVQDQLNYAKRKAQDIGQRTRETARA
ncbi:hypothetical protein L1987_47422 [Smallanthus sonchifolius]|uniref:Uncharacterized protein n=1 Tax=Smallanthus sonchifolius TaxID=185202 RepID=A0ACB9G2J6_9ASTR|nr:hypothetical protein L1987_47422 [Smallanthus sonchifolius]